MPAETPKSNSVIGTEVTFDTPAKVKAIHKLTVYIVVIYKYQTIVTKIEYVHDGM